MSPSSSLFLMSWIWFYFSSPSFLGFCLCLTTAAPSKLKILLSLGGWKSESILWPTKGRRKWQEEKQLIGVRWDDLCAGLFKSPNVWLLDKEERKPGRAGRIEVLSCISEIVFPERQCPNSVWSEPILPDGLLISNEVTSRSFVEDPPRVEQFAQAAWGLGCVFSFGGGVMRIFWHREAWITSLISALLWLHERLDLLSRDLQVGNGWGYRGPISACIIEWTKAIDRH